MENSTTKTIAETRPKIKKVKRPFQYYDLYEVWWDDAAGLRNGWMERTEHPKPQMVISVGFLISETEDHIIIAQDTDPDGQHNGRTQIPRGMIKHAKILRKKDQHKDDGKHREQQASGL